MKIGLIVKHARLLQVNIVWKNTCKTKTHLDNVGVIIKDLRSSLTDKITKDSSGYFVICKTRYDNKKKHIELDQHKENDKESFERTMYIYRFYPT